ncbi:MAG: pyruvate dehydrogenase (acetyl-transferring), homodimeric type [Planctomycetota bacterium]|jgi:pyruvate dehydrogenase E1 component
MEAGRNSLDINYAALPHEEELQDWLESFDEAVQLKGKEWGERILRNLRMYAQSIGVNLPLTSVTPYTNTIPPSLEPEYPGNLAMEKRILDLIRWNAMLMVHKANSDGSGRGGHIATFASSAVLYEVGQNHFFKGRHHPDGPDLVYFQGHASPGMYARGFLEGRFSSKNLDNFRSETGPDPGLSSYPHPWLMPDYWQFPTVSMGLNAISSIYHARFIRYLEDRGLKESKNQKLWAFLGDGECDEPESLGAINLASREKLDNLIFVINCNLQRLDGPVRGNGKIIQELEGTFRGSGWKVIKVIWGSDWDPIFSKDRNNLIIKRAGEIPDGEFQKYSVEPGWYMREHFFGKDQRMLDLVSHLSDEELKSLMRGGHDFKKVYAAYRAAQESDGRPTVIIAKTIKGYGMDESGEGLNIAHNSKVMSLEALKAFRTKFNLEIEDSRLENPEFFRPPEKGPEIRYLLDRRKSLGGFIPERKVSVTVPEQPSDKIFAEYSKGSDRDVSTTMVFVRMLAKLLKDKNIGKFLVPIVPDESRTFGLDALFRQCGIYSHVGQLYEPVDSANVLYYKEAKEGQILEEGITEAGSMASFTAAATAYANHGIPTIPIYMFYSIFGIQRTGDQVWLCGDARARGFMIGCTAGRTTLNGEGLQHQDGHSHVIWNIVPNAKAYDPAYSYEIAAIVKDGIKRMTAGNEDLLYYLTIGNENYQQTEMPEGAEEGILRGIYLFKKGINSKSKKAVQLFGSGPMLKEAVKAQQLLRDDFDISSNVWSVTSYKELRDEALGCDRRNMYQSNGKRETPYITRTLEKHTGPVVAVSDFMKLLPDSISRWLPQQIISLGTDGYGRSDRRDALRNHFEISPQHIAFAALHALYQEKKVTKQTVNKAMKKYGIDPDKQDPRTA